MNPTSEHALPSAAIVRSACAVLPSMRGATSTTGISEKSSRRETGIAIYWLLCRVVEAESDEIIYPTIGRLQREFHELFKIKNAMERTAERSRTGLFGGENAAADAV